jgi:hypothetical protein
MDWMLDLLNTYIHHSELQVITVPLLISTIHRSPQHPLSHFPASCVFNSRSLTTASNSGDSSASRAHVVTVRRISRNWTLVDCQVNSRAFSSQPSLQSSTQLNSLTHQPTTSLHFTSLHFTSLNWTELHSVKVRVKVKVTLRLAVYRQSVCLVSSLLRPTTKDLFPQLNPYVTSSLTRRWICLLWICLAFRQMYISHT